MKKLYIAFFLFLVGTLGYGQIKGGASPVFIYNNANNESSTNVYFENNVVSSFVKLFEGLPTSRFSATGENSTSMAAEAIRNCPIGSIIIWCNWLPRSNSISWTRAVVLQDYLLTQSFYFIKE